MTSFADETAALMPSPFVLPDEFRAFFDWCEGQGDGWLRRYSDHTEDGLQLQDRVAKLFDWSAGSGTDVHFRLLPPIGGIQVAAPWRGAELPETKDRILPFARIGGDGTEAAYWIDDDGRQRIVAVGSGSGSQLACVLTDRPVDFLRLIAIGYFELASADEWTQPPVAGDDDWPLVNEPYRSWVETTFGVTIPATASEIVPRPAEYGDTDTEDDFALWLKSFRDDL